MAIIGRKSTSAVNAVKDVSDPFKCDCKLHILWLTVIYAFNISSRALAKPHTTFCFNNCLWTQDTTKSKRRERHFKEV